jgi:hypothetical protein
MPEINRPEPNRSDSAESGITTALAGAQCELLSQVEAMWTGWMQRQREAIDASARSLTRIYECRDLARIVQIQQEWLADTVRRTATDMTVLANEANDLTWRVARVGRTVVGAAGAAAAGHVGQKSAPPMPRGPQDQGPLRREAAE